MNLANRARAGVSYAEVGKLREEGLRDLVVTLFDDVEWALRVKVWRACILIKAYDRVVDEVCLLS